MFRFSISSFGVLALMARLCVSVVFADDRAASTETWWAFEPLRDVAPPSGGHGIDAFVSKRLADAGLSSAPTASPETLLRRLYYQMIGLPPSPSEIAAFVADPSRDAWEKRIDALLADPRYGEHWATMWLDLVRYSESDGWNQDAYRPHLWRYRDYVVGAFNDDKPYSVFVREQLAGDQLEGERPDGRIAAGFLRLGIYEYNQRDARGHWNDILNEMTDTAGDVFLGMSVACARCHDHKFDDITQRDYFKLRAFFEPVIFRDDLDAAAGAERAAYEEQQAVWEAATREIRAEIDALVKPYHDKKWRSTVDKFPLDIQACFHKPESERTSWEHQMAYLVSRQFLEEGGGPLKSISKEDKKRLDDLEAQLAEYDHLKPKSLPPVMTVSTYAGEHAPTQIPGGAKQETVPVGYMSALKGEVLSSSERPTSRMDLADWIAHPRNPLTTRVIVNRVWQQHFGQGLVATGNDFGRKGGRPSHPELLDWLTREFIANGWQFKYLHRLILTSDTWRQSSEHPDAVRHQEQDPEERLLWRARARRLPAEAIHDSMLLLSGELIERLGGPSVDRGAPRRALYMKRFRNVNDTFLHAFDLAPGLKSVALRNCTTTPTQSLTMINGEFTLNRATAWARRLREQTDQPGDFAAQAMRWAWGRSPTREELEKARSFLGESLETDKATDFCHVLFNSNEFLYIR